MHKQSPELQACGPAGGELIARHYLTGETLRIQWSPGRITSCDPVQQNGAAPWIAPGLLDLQVNGYAEVDFQKDGLTVEQLLHAVRALRKDGCTRFLLTLITDRWDRLLERLAKLVHLRAQTPELQHAIQGWHIEGPFLSSEPGFHGAHDPALMIDPRAEHIQALRQITSSDLFLITLSPERRGAIEAIAEAKRLGMCVFIGHTNASAEIISAAVNAGISGFTHLGNGCSAELNRHDNILWRVFDAEIPFVSLIPDGVHVAPALFRLMHRALRSEILYVSDAMSAASAAPGSYTLGSLSLEVGPDRVVRKPASPYLAGSALDPLRGVITAGRMLNCPWQQTWRRYSEVPGQLIGVSTQIAVGEPLNLCLIEERGAELTIQPLTASSKHFPYFRG